MSEMFALAFKETNRGMLFGTKTIGCLGSTNILNLIDGSIFQYTVSEFVGGVTNAAYNNIGVTPDHSVPDNQAVDVAATFLREQIAKGAKPQHRRSSRNCSFRRDTFWCSLRRSPP